MHIHANSVVDIQSVHTHAQSGMNASQQRLLSAN